MNKFAWLITWLTAQAIALYHFVGGITVSLVLGIPIVFLFGDTLLSLLGHGLMVLEHGVQLLFEVFETIAGHFLEWVFHLSKRTAEIIIFWSSLAIAIGLSWYLMRKAHSAALLIGLQTFTPFQFQNFQPKILRMVYYQPVIKLINCNQWLLFSNFTKAWTMTL